MKEIIKKEILKMNNTEKILVLNSIMSVNKNNAYVYENGRYMKTKECIYNQFKMSRTTVNRNVKKDFFVRKCNDRNVLFFNPLFNDNYTPDSFKMFEDIIKEKLEKNTYLKIKSKFFKVDNYFGYRNFSDLDYEVSGIYRLYKNNSIVYVGKSKNIKSRVLAHKNEKDIDGFDFVVLDRESDKNVYEIYYISKLKPLYNKDCIEDDECKIELKELIFTDVISLSYKI